jgi:GNAT superfamily N-acetyltransferase
VDTAATVRRLEQGLATSWARQARWVPRSTIRHLGGVLVVLSGVRDQTQQVAVVEAPVPDPEASVVAAEVCFADAGWRPAFDLAAGAHPEIEAVLADRGFQVVESRPGMLRGIGRRDWPVVAAPAHLELGVSRDRDQIVEVQREAFDLHPQTARGLVPNAMFADPAVAVVVARTEPRGPVVGSVTVHLDGEVGAIVGTAVTRSHRRQGIGSALTGAALDLAHGHGIDSVWLQATPDGEPVYTRMGFVEVATCQVWLR